MAQSINSSEPESSIELRISECESNLNIHNPQNLSEWLGTVTRDTLDIESCVPTMKIFRFVEGKVAITCGASELCHGKVEYRQNEEIDSLREI